MGKTIGRDLSAWGLGNREAETAAGIINRDRNNLSDNFLFFKLRTKPKTAKGSRKTEFWPASLNECLPLPSPIKKRKSKEK